MNLPYLFGDFNAELDPSVSLGADFINGLSGTGLGNVGRSGALSF